MGDPYRRSLPPGRCNPVVVRSQGENTLFLITLFCDPSPLTQGLLWLPPPAAVVSISPEEVSFKQGQGGGERTPPE